MKTPNHCPLTGSRMPQNSCRGKKTIIDRKPSTVGGNTNGKATNDSTKGLKNNLLRANHQARGGEMINNISVVILASLKVK